MDNPLNSEQTEELNEIIKLPREKQAAKLKEFLSTLSQEQVEFIKQSQTQHCLFCGIVLGTVQSHKLYENNNLSAVLDINPANPGHALIIPKIHAKNSYKIDSKIFEIANLISRKMKEKLDADSNIFIANGENAGQKIEHAVVHVIPRYKNDKIGLTWSPKKINEEQLSELSSILKIEEKKEIKKEKIIIKTGKRKERIP